MTLACIQGLGELLKAHVLPRLWKAVLADEQMTDEAWRAMERRDTCLQLLPDPEDECLSRAVGILHAYDDD